MVEYAKRTGQVPSFNEWRVISKLASRQEYRRIINTLQKNNLIRESNRGGRKFVLSKDLSGFAHGYKYDVVPVEGYGVFDNNNNRVRMFRTKKAANAWFKALQSRMKQPYDVIDSEGYVVKSFKNEGLAKSWISKQGYEAAPFHILGRKNRKGKFTYEVIDPKSGQVTKSPPPTMTT